MIPWWYWLELAGAVMVLAGFSVAVWGVNMREVLWSGCAALAVFVFVLCGVEVPEKPDL